MRVITRLNVGGPARQVLALQKEMARLGVDETLITGCVDEGEADLAEMLDSHDFVRVEALTRPIRPLKDAKAYRQIDRLIRTLRPDVVHTHLSKAGLLGRISALRRHVPVTVHTFHGHVLEAYFSKSFGRVIKATERSIGRRTSALLAVGEGVRQDLIDFGVASPEQVRVIPAGIDLSPFTDIGPPGGDLRRRFGIPEDSTVIGFAGRFVPVKRIDRLTQAARSIAESAPDVHFILCGGGPDEPIITDAMATAPLAGRMHLVGWLSDLRSFYETADVVFLTSDNEGTPISLIEAGAAGRPVVSTAVGGVEDVVVDGTTGYVVSSDASDIARAISRLATNPRLAREMGSAARKHILPRYGAARLASDLIATYERELKSASLSNNITQ